MDIGFRPPRSSEHRQQREYAISHAPIHDEQLLRITKVRETVDDIVENIISRESAETIDKLLSMVCLKNPYHGLNYKIKNDRITMLFIAALDADIEVHEKGLKLKSLPEELFPIMKLVKKMLTFPDITKCPDDQLQYSNIYRRALCIASGKIPRVLKGRKSLKSIESEFLTKIEKTLNALEETKQTEIEELEADISTRLKKENPYENLNIKTKTDRVKLLILSYQKVALCSLDSMVAWKKGLWIDPFLRKYLLFLGSNVSPDIEDAILKMNSRQHYDMGGLRERAHMILHHPDAKLPGQQSFLEILSKIRKRNRKKTEKDVMKATIKLQTDENTPTTQEQLRFYEKKILDAQDQLNRLERPTKSRHLSHDTNLIR